MHHTKSFTNNFHYLLIRSTSLFRKVGTYYASLLRVVMSFGSGIGFKSVFLISNQPHIFSNGYQIKFNEKPCTECNIGYIVPEWVDSTPSLSDIKEIYGCSKVLPTTTIILPLKCEKVDAVKKQLSSMHPEMLLFLSKIRKLSV
jgi:hypothetical protein